MWGSISAAREISLGRDSRVDSAAEVALSYCEKAADILHEMGCTALNAVEDLFVVGGMENLRAYLSHKITKQKYYDKIVEDLTLDTGMAVLGGIIGAVGGGVGGAEVGVVGGPVGVAAGASKGAALGATKGAAAGYVAARAARAAVNATVNLFKGGSRSGGGKEEPGKNERKTEEVRKSDGNKTETSQRNNEVSWHKLPRAEKLKIQKEFVENKVRIERKWEKSQHKIGGREAWKDLSNDNTYYTRDNRHGDIEVWKVSGKRAEHQGSVESISGRMYRKPNHAPQSFE